MPTDSLLVAVCVVAMFVVFGQGRTPGRDHLEDEPS
jgi:hypothetical protein